MKNKFLLFLSGLFLISVVSAFTYPAVSSDMLLYCHFDGNVSDSSESHYNFTSPSSNNWLSFDGVNDGVQIINSPSYAGSSTTGYSVFLWVNQSVSSPSDGVLLRTGSGISSDFWDISTLSSDLFVFDIGSSPFCRATGPLLNDSLWHSIGFVVSSNSTGVVNISSYVDGSLYFTNTSCASNVFSPVSQSALSIRIGRSSSTFFNGSIDEVRIYNRSISSSEVAQINLSGLIINSSINSTGLVAWYPMEDGSGEFLDDYSVNSNTGNITSSTWSSSSLSYSFVSSHLNEGLVTSSLTSGLSSATNFDFDSTGNYTFIFVSSTQHAGEDQVLFSLGNSTAGLRFYTSNDDFIVTLTNSTGSSNYQTVLGNLTNGEYVFYTVVYQDKYADVYYKGSYQSTLNLSLAVSYNGTFTIGYDSLISSAPYNGTLDEFLIYDRVLSLDEISLLHINYMGTPVSGPPGSPGSQTPVEVLTGGGSLSQLLNSWNPDVYPDLVVQLRDLFSGSDLSEFSEDLFHSIRLLILYVLRQPGSLVPQGGVQ